MYKSAFGGFLGLLVYAIGWLFEIAIWLTIRQSPETPQIVQYMRSLPRDETFPYAVIGLTVILGFPLILAWITVRIYDGGKQDASSHD